MNENRLPKKILYGQLPNAKRSIGRPLLRYKGKLKDNLKRLDIDLSAWENLVLDRKEWRKTCFARLKSFEENRLKHRDQLRLTLKQKHMTPALEHFICQCGFIARSRAGLLSHLRKHKMSS